MLEEVGIEIQNLVLLSNNIREKDDKGKLFIVYTAKYGSGDPVALEGTEIVEWKESHELDDLDFTPLTKEVVGLACKKHEIKK